MKFTRPHRFAKRVALRLIDVGNAKRYRPCIKEEYNFMTSRKWLGFLGFLGFMGIKGFFDDWPYFFFFAFFAYFVYFFENKKKD